MKKEMPKVPFKLYTRSGSGIIISSHYSDDAMEIAEVVSGRVRFQIGTVFFEAAEGELIFVPPTMVFRADAVSDFAAVRGVSFNSSILEANMDKVDVDILYMFYVQAKNKISVFKSEHPTHATLAKYMQNSHDEDGSKEVCYKLPIRANIYLMMTELLRYYCGSKDELDRMIYHNVMRLRPVVDYISEHYGEKIYIETLSDMITVSPDYFTKMFKDSIGKTPIDYINGIRINHALRLLATTETPINDISDSLGFSNPNYFHKIFKQYMLTSPLAYRKSSKL